MSTAFDDPDDERSPHPGGWAEGAPDQVDLTWVHGGEYVMSADMLSGKGGISHPIGQCWKCDWTAPLTDQDGEAIAPRRRFHLALLHEAETHEDNPAELEQLKAYLARRWPNEEQS